MSNIPDESFRDTIATINAEGKRNFIYHLAWKLFRMNSFCTRLIMDSPQVFGKTGAPILMVIHPLDFVMKF